VGVGGRRLDRRSCIEVVVVVDDFGIVDVGDAVVVVYLKGTSQHGRDVPINIYIGIHKDTYIYIQVEAE
jgi:hypothetical protein